MYSVHGKDTSEIRVLVHVMIHVAITPPKSGRKETENRKTKSPEIAPEELLFFMSNVHEKGTSEVSVGGFVLFYT